MKPTIKSLIGGGAKLLLPLLLINSAFADATSDARIQAYKSNKLLSSEIVLPTTTNTEDSQEVVFFNSSGLVWNNDTAANAKGSILNDKYGDWTLQDFKDAFGDYDFYWEPSFDEMRDYLSKVAHNELTNSNLDPSDALAYLQEQWDNLNMYSGNDAIKAFPLKGIDLGDTLEYIDLTMCTGMSTEQLAGIKYMNNVYLPQISLPSNFSFTGAILNDVNMTQIDGLTPEMLLTANSIHGGTYAFEFSGSENLSSWDLTDANLSQCTGLKASQLLTANSNTIDRANLGSIEFDNADLTGMVFNETDFSKATGMTGAFWVSQINNYKNKFPEVYFNGNEDLCGADLSNKDVTNCHGITASQIANITGLSGMRVTAEQYNTWLPTFKSDINWWSGTQIYVDGVATNIPYPDWYESF